jgi:hypothetical protein
VKYAGDAGIGVFRGVKLGCRDAVFDWTVDDEVLTAVGCCFTHFRVSSAAKMTVGQRDGVIVLNADVNSLSDSRGARTISSDGREEVNKRSTVLSLLRDDEPSAICWCIFTARRAT